MNRMSLAPVLPEGRFTVAFGMACRAPFVSKRKPAMFGVPCAFSTYTKSSNNATLLGNVPPDGDLLRQTSFPLITSKTEISLLPALAANRIFPSPPNTSEFCDPRGSAPLAPVPFPPVMTSLSQVREPLPERRYWMTEFPALLFVIT